MVVRANGEIESEEEKEEEFDAPTEEEEDLEYAVDGEILPKPIKCGKRAATLEHFSHTLPCPRQRV
ncbi:Transposon Ty3-I Gag-Pol polyprotein [Gossypium australe]|uniref:Transposon Ty3-I Gag-Pol polyprotein n=1 Tax=Gossypium australe TaxID=47621 RepID=A0A5B6WVX9_9ROSI|nr:Transposon Ty3-I Gag-Pol polyprotein [Gossypium australe]